MSGQKKESLCVFALIMIGLMFYFQSIYFGFLNIDDPIHTTENIAVKSFDLKGLLFQCYIGLYHPLTTLSFAFDWWLGGSKPWMFHLSNLILHIFATLILLNICLKLWPKKYLLGFLISLTFLVHPLKAESVVWITERKDVLSGLFLWLTIYIYLFYLDQKRLWQYIFANIAFIFAVTSKVSVVTLPIILFVIDWYKSQRLDFRSLVTKVPFFITAFIFGTMNVLEQSRMYKDVIYPKKNYVDLFYQTQFYLQKFLFPWDLRAWYSREYLNINLVGLASILLICSLAIMILKRSSSHKKDLLLGLSMFLLFLFPNIKIITPGDPNLVNDRYMYIALTGLTFAFFPFILHAIDRLWKNKRRIISVTFTGAFSALVIQWLYLMYLQIPYWKDSVTLWERTAKLEPNTKIVAGSLGKALLRDRRYKEALPYLQRSEGRVEDYEDLGDVLIELKRAEEAESTIKVGLKKYPNNSALLNVLGRIDYDYKEFQNAHGLFTKALQNLKDEISPKLRAKILNNLGLSNLQLGNYNTAESIFREALAIYGDDEKIVYNLGLSILNQNRTEEAKDVFLRAISINPNRPEVYNSMAVILYQENNFAEARVWFTRALDVDPYFELAKYNLKEMKKEGH